MLARNEELKSIADYLPPIDPLPEVHYSGFPRWLGLLPEVNRESRSADRLARLNIYCYLPRFSRVICRRGGRSCRRWYAVLPGLMFVPVEFMDVANRDRVLDWAHIRTPHFIRTAGGTGILAKADIERIRQMEAELNLPPSDIPAANGRALKPGARARFLAGSFQWLGEGVVVDVASKARIGVEVDQLFGARRKVYVPAREIEVM